MNIAPFLVLLEATKNSVKSNGILITPDMFWFYNLVMSLFAITLIFVTIKFGFKEPHRIKDYNPPVHTQQINLDT